MDDPRHNPPIDPRRGIEWALQADAVQDVLAGLDEAVRRRRRRGLVRLGATAAMVVLVGSLLWMELPRGKIGITSPMVIAPERMVLDDGSIVELEHGSLVHVDFSSTQRRVELRSGGAHFAVAKNPSRPFVVTVDGTEVRAIGTAFHVGRQANGFDVVVTEGVVAVQKSSAGPVADGMMAKLSAGEGIAVVAEADGSLQTRVLAEPDRRARLAWRVPRINLYETPLSEAVALVNQHSSDRLALGQPELGQLKVSGVIRADNIPALVQLVEAEYGLTTELLPDGSRVLFRRP